MQKFQSHPAKFVLFAGLLCQIFTGLGTDCLPYRNSLSPTSKYSHDSIGNGNGNGLPTFLHHIEIGTPEEEVLGLNHSYFKLGRSHEIQYFANLLAKQIRADLGEDLSDWILVTPCGPKLPNAITQLAVKLARNLKIKRKTLLLPVDRMSVKHYADVRTKEERKKILAGQFHLSNHAPLRGKKVIFIDDNYVSGALYEEAMRTLKREGANEVKSYILYQIDGHGDHTFEGVLNKKVLKEMGLNPLQIILNSPKTIYSRRLVYACLTLAPDSFQKLLKEIKPEAKLKLYLTCLDQINKEHLNKPSLKNLRSLQTSVRRILPNRLIARKFKGVIFGTAVGDALGMPLEGKSRAQIKQRHPNGLSSMQEGIGWVTGKKGETFEFPPGHVTDDTVLMMALARHFIENEGVWDQDLAAFTLAHSYHDRVGFSKATRDAFQKIRSGTSWRDLDRSARVSNGAAMRIAPIAMMYYNHPEELENKLIESIEITHANPVAMIGGLLQGVALAKLLNTKIKNFDRETFLDELIAKTLEWEDRYYGSNGHPYKHSFSIRLKKIKELLARDNVTAEKVNSELGFETFDEKGRLIETDRADKTVVAALYSFLSHPLSYRESVVFAANLGGDTDTIAAMTGALSGALLGKDEIPLSWIEMLYLSDDILETIGMESVSTVHTLDTLATRLLILKLVPNRPRIPIQLTLPFNGVEASL